MPGSILNADINFPHFTGNETTETKIDAIQNYLYMLYEQLRYSMGNLGTENFSEGGIKDLEQIVAKNIDITGMVTFRDLETEGATIINGANITTGTISADRLSLTGAITFEDLSTGAGGLGTRFTNAESNASSALAGAGAAYDLANQIRNGTVTGTFINGRTIYSPTIKANEFDVLPSNATDYDGTFSIFSNYSAYSPIFQILYDGNMSGGAPGTQLWMPIGGDLYLGGGTDRVTINTNTFLRSGYNYGTSLPGSGTEGQLFFVI